MTRLLRSAAPRPAGAISLSRAAVVTAIVVVAFVGAGAVSLVRATSAFDAVAHRAAQPSLSERVARDAMSSLAAADGALDQWLMRGRAVDLRRWRQARAALRGDLRELAGRAAGLPPGASAPVVLAGDAYLRDVGELPGRRARHRALTQYGGEAESLRGALERLAHQGDRADRAAVSAAAASAHRYRRAGVVGLALALGVLMLFAALLFRTLLSPLRQLRRLAERIGNGGGATTLDGPVSAELRELAGAMGAAADRDRQLSGELEEARLEILDRLARATEHRDDDTYEHTERVGALAARLGQSLGLDVAEVRLLSLAAPLHDIGKVGVADRILLKPGRLNPAEIEHMQRHTTIGAQMLAGSSSPVLRMAEEIARCHHERWDGRGYPHGLRQGEIPLSARIVAVADVFDALTHDRPYKSAWSVERATAELARNAGTQFDPQIVDALLDLGHATLQQAAMSPLPVAPEEVPAGAVDQDDRRGPRAGTTACGSPRAMGQPTTSSHRLART